ncbi:hypothetical protein [Vibrio mangrovi]|uniref:Lipoprotein n=1 Tax=Vibrio mangrovi TaxID=474394 RepID=A0A1Y6IWV8_9VIBR|nr:hypothetical protein [Vibrio mangrovi]SMS02165.1 hypothetical protein VIM7927_03483 [Vibrio mangrovi]
MKYLRFYCLISLLLTACANQTSIHRDLDVDSGKGAFIDIKQRAVIVSHQIRDKGKRTIVCAEPSPDSMSALAGETSISVPNKIKLANAFQEGAAYTGLRTQSIQILRDGMFRLCEAYMSGAIDESSYGLLLRRYQKNMVALLAIEQLTATIKAPSPTISTSGAASVARDVSELKEMLTETKSQIKVLENNQSRTEDEENQLADLKEQKAVYESGIKNGNQIVASGQATATILSQSGGEIAEVSSEVTNAIKDIVLKIIDTDDLPAMCLSAIMHSDDKLAVYKSCVDLLNKTAQTHIAELEADIAYNKGVQTQAEKATSSSELKKVPAPRHTESIRSSSGTLLFQLDIKARDQ